MIRLIFVALALFAFDCARPPPLCTPKTLAVVVAECKAAQAKAGCADDPTKCPDLTRACHDRVNALTDREACQ